MNFRVKLHLPLTAVARVIVAQTELMAGEFTVGPKPRPIVSCLRISRSSFADRFRMRRAKVVEREVDAILFERRDATRIPRGEKRIAVYCWRIVRPSRMRTAPVKSSLFRGTGIRFSNSGSFADAGILWDPLWSCFVLVESI